MKTAPKILIVDDDPDFVAVLQDALKHEGLETLTAAEGVRAIEIAKCENPDLILLDLQLPTGMGQWVLTNLRSGPKTKNIPVIIVTGTNNPSMERETRLRGANDFLRKPFDMDVLNAKIRALLG